LFGGGGQQYGQRQHPEHGEAVTLVGAELLGLGDQAGRAHDGAKFFEDSSVHMLSSYGEQSARRGGNNSPGAKLRHKRSAGPGGTGQLTPKTLAAKGQARRLQCRRYQSNILSINRPKRERVRAN